MPQESSQSSSVSFGVSLRDWSRIEDLVAAARAAEDNEMDVVTVPDHLGGWAPFQLLAAAAAVTSRVRLRTYVLDSYFWNPALLAREVATLDRLSGGRVEVGIGAGHMRHEHEAAGLPFPGTRQRWWHTEQVVTELRERLEDDHKPEPVQRPVPIMMAAMGEQGLSTAARMADIVGLAGLLQVPGQQPGTFTMAGSAVTEERVELVRDVAGREGRSPRLDVLLQWVVLDEDPQASADKLASEAREQGSDWFTPELLLDSPFLLFASSAEEASAELRKREERWGISCWSTHSRSADALARVAAVHRG
ncbi:MAG TPA: TIGR03621 family F420-dependent LLM class oxidoreductase [Actinomycetales bacterium]|nr:TIGR03621 family F420-dependent LLM class oxidoreductase [Actinomycetales bacterium]